MTILCVAPKDWEDATGQSPQFFSEGFEDRHLYLDIMNKTIVKIKAIAIGVAVLRQYIDLSLGHIPVSGHSRDSEFPR